MKFNLSIGNGYLFNYLKLSQIAYL